MIRIFALLFIPMALHAQSQGDLPQPIDAMIFDSPAQIATNKIVVPENIAVGDTILVGYSQIATGGSCTSGPYPIADTLGNTWTRFPVFTTAGLTFSLNADQIACTVSTGSGADTITVTPDSGCGNGTIYKRFPAAAGLTCNLDGSQQTASYTAGSGSGVTGLSTSNTTTINGDILVTNSICICPSIVDQGDNSQLIAESTNGGLQSFRMINADAPGTYQSSVSVVNGHEEVAMATVALKPSSLKIVTDKLADCAVGQPCVQNLRAIGGTAPTYAWGIVSGAVPGMSLNGTSGQYADAGSGPTTAGSYSVNFQVHDGTNVATRTLTLKVAPSFLTPSLGQTDTTNSFNNGGATFSPFASPVSCGDSVLMLMTGADDTHTTEGWLQALSGSANHYSATVGGVTVPVQKVAIYGTGMFFGPTYGILFGPFANSGSFTVSGFNNQGSSSSLGMGFYQLTNVQAVIDPAVSFGKTVTSDGTITSSLTTVEPNTFVAVLTQGTQADTATYSAPFSVVTSNGSTYAYATISSPSTVNITATMTSHNGGCSPNCGENYAQYAVALRPAVSTIACPVSPAPRHRTDVK